MFIRDRNFQIDLDVEWPRAHDETQAILVAARLRNTLGADDVVSHRVVIDFPKSEIESAIVETATEVIADLVGRLDEGLGFTCPSCDARYQLTKGGRLRPVEKPKGDA